VHRDEILSHLASLEINQHICLVGRKPNKRILLDRSTVQIHLTPNGSRHLWILLCCICSFMVELEINIGDVEIRQPGFKSSTPRGNLEGAESADYRPNSI
jgi:hypothetical protein